jgi:hypothetical protein
LKEKQIYAKPSKCASRVQEVEYLGHIVSHEGVKVDPNKIKAMREWPIPKTLKKNLKEAMCTHLTLQKHFLWSVIPQAMELVFF